jgi:hypothetical protein
MFVWLASRLLRACPIVLQGPADEGAGELAYGLGLILGLLAEERVFLGFELQGHFDPDARHGLVATLISFS